MRLSEQATSLIKSLYEKLPVFRRLLGKSRWDLDIVEQLVQCGEPAAIPALAPMLFTGTVDETVAGARAIERLLSRAMPEDLASLDERMRGSWVFGISFCDRWRKLEPRELALWVGPGEPGRLLRLSSFHSDGFVREEAVRRLGLIEDGSELPYLLLRLNDWVAEVREAAQRAVSSRIQSRYAEHFVKNLALVTRLERVGRADHTPVLDSIMRLLSEPAARPLLVFGMRSSSKIVRRTCFGLLVANRPDKLPAVLIQALEGEDPVIRLWAVRLISQAISGVELESVLRRLSEDLYAPVRREALRVWVDRFPADTARDQLLSSLLDLSRIVREEARFHLRGSHGIDFARFYREALATDGTRTLVPALSGLVETGGSADAELVLAYGSHVVARVRRISAQGLIRLGGRKYIQTVLGMVLDISPSISAQARATIAPDAATVGTAKLWTLFEKAAFPHARMNFLHLIAALPKWESISSLIAAADHEDRAIARTAARYLIRWNARCNRSQSAPSRDQLSRLETALSRSPDVIPGNTLSMIRFTVDSLSRKEP